MVFCDIFYAYDLGAHKPWLTREKNVISTPSLVCGKHKPSPLHSKWKVREHSCETGKYKSSAGSSDLNTKYKLTPGLTNNYVFSGFQTLHRLDTNDQILNTGHDA